MSPRLQHGRLSDIAAAIDAIRRHSTLRDGPDGLSPVVADAVKYRLVEIGEAVSDLSPTTKAMRPDVPWNEIKGTRNLLAHEYFEVDMHIIWAIVDEHLDVLDQAVADLRGPSAH